MGEYDCNEFIPEMRVIISDYLKERLQYESGLDYELNRSDCLKDLTELIERGIAAYERFLFAERELYVRLLIEDVEWDSNQVDFSVTTSNGYYFYVDARQDDSFQPMKTMRMQEVAALIDSAFAVISAERQTSEAIEALDQRFRRLNKCASLYAELAGREIENVWKGHASKSSMIAAAMNPAVF